MKNHELLDIIGEVNGEYVQAADSNAARPRFRWKAFAACAACAALIAAAYPISQAFRPTLDSEAPTEPATALIEAPGLHKYTLIEAGVSIVTTQGSGKPTLQCGTTKSPSGNGQEPAPDPAPNASGMVFPQFEGDVPVDEPASTQYDSLYRNAGLDNPPDWFAGAWLDWPSNTARLAVAIVDGYRTQALEAQIVAMAGGGEVLFVDAKYSKRFLDGLMDKIAQVFENLDCRLSSVYSVDVTDNCLGLDFFGGTPSDEVLAALAELDPEGDAIRIQVFTSGRISFADMPAPDPAEPGTELGPEKERPEPALDPEAHPTPIDMSDYTAQAGTPSSAPAGARPVRDEDGHDIPGAMEELPQAKYDAIAEGE